MEIGLVSSFFCRAMARLGDLYFGRPGPRAPSLEGLPHVRAALHLTLVAALTNKRPTCFLSQTLHPASSVLHLILMHSRTPWERVVARHLEQEDFDKMEASLWQLHDSALCLARFGPTEREAAFNTLNCMALNQRLQVVVSEHTSLPNLESWRPDFGSLSEATGVCVHLVGSHSADADRLNRRV